MVVVLWLPVTEVREGIPVCHSPILRVRGKSAVVAASLCIRQIDGISTSIIIIGASIGDMTIPALAAYIMVAFGTATFPSIILCCSIGCSVFFSLMFYFGHREEVNLDHSSSASKNESKSNEMITAI